MCKIFTIDEGVNIMEEELLFFDELTKIYNRKGFFKYTASLLEEHPGIDFCLIYWNIRQFKVLNNLFGMQSGICCDMRRRQKRIINNFILQT